MPASVQSKHRLFFALRPDKTLARKLHSLAAPLRCAERERVMASSLIHMTIRYVGLVDAATQTCLQTMAQNIHVEKFEFTLQSLGYWKKPRVIWSAPTSWPESLNQLVMHLEQGCQHCGGEAETRTFNPHVSLIRKATAAPLVNSHPPLLWHAADFALVESKSTRNGVEYQIVNRWPLN